jgi:hypothetical protein
MRCARTATIANDGAYRLVLKGLVYVICALFRITGKKQVFVMRMLPGNNFKAHLFYGKFPTLIVYFPKDRRSRRDNADLVTLL